MKWRRGLKGKLYKTYYFTNLIAINLIKSDLICFIINNALIVLRASSCGVPVTIHAGEWPTEDGLNTLENVEFAWRHLNARRIGHGIALRADKNLAKTVEEMQCISALNEHKNPLTIEVNVFNTSIS